MGIRELAGLAFTCLLAACGGGGGGNDGGGDGQDLTVSVSYAGGSLMLFKQAHYVPTLNGFEGHAPHCLLVDGRLPTGTQLQPDCSIGGVPTAIEATAFTVRVGADGVSNTIDVFASINVGAPQFTYVALSAFSLHVGDEFNLGPQTMWSTEAGEAPLTWTYAIRSGALPPGLALDPGTGQIHGIVAGPGSFSVEVEATVASVYGVVQLPNTAQWAANVAP